MLLRRHLRTLAANNAGVAEHKVIYDAAGISRLSALLGPLLGVDARTVIRDGDLLGRTIEIKSSASPDSYDARHLAWFRDAIGDRFAAGIVLHAGPRKFNLGDRIDALPISCLWGA